MHCSDKQNKGVVLHMKKKQHPICSVLLNIYCLTKEEFPLALINHTKTDVLYSRTSVTGIRLTRTKIKISLKFTPITRILVLVTPLAGCHLISSS